MILVPPLHFLDGEKKYFVLFYLTISITYRNNLSLSSVFLLNGRIDFNREVMVFHLFCFVFLLLFFCLFVVVVVVVLFFSIFIRSWIGVSRR